MGTDELLEALTNYLFVTHTRMHTHIYSLVATYFTRPPNVRRRYHSQAGKGSSEFALSHVLQPTAYAYDPLCLCVSLFSAQKY